MTRRAVLLGLLLCAAVPAWAADPPGVINYQGVLRDATQKPLDGTYSMVFRFYGAALAGDQVLVDTWAAVPVSKGVFSVRLGTGSVTDGSGPGQYLSLTRAFQDYPNLHLEVQVGSEILSPRIPIASSGYALNARLVRGTEIVSAGPLTLYVNGATGNDGNDGLSPAAAKRTIQGAVRVIPVVLNGDVTIEITDGTYNEMVFLGHRSRNGVYAIRLMGNESSPSNVLLDGTGQAGFPGMGILIADFYVEIRGMSFSNWNEDAALWIDSGSHVEIWSSEFIGNIGPESAALRSTGSVDIFATTFQMNTTGIVAEEGGLVGLHDNSDVTDNFVGLKAERNSGIHLGDVTVCSITNNDMFAEDHSTISGYGNCLLTNSNCYEMDPSARCVP